jgi:CHAT domain-containing protein
MVDLGESDEIDALITQFRKDVTTAGPKYDLLPQTGSGLRKALFEPLKYFIGDSKRLFLAPDGDLFKLPFEVLPYNDTAHGNHLIDYYTITYITTSSYILRFGNTLSDSHSEPVIIGDPDFDLRGNNTATNNYPNYSILPNRVYFYRLPGTRTEAEKIANMFGVKPWWLGASAIKSNLLSLSLRMPSHLRRYLYFMICMSSSFGTGRPYPGVLIRSRSAIPRCKAGVE